MNRSKKVFGRIWGFEIQTKQMPIPFQIIPVSMSLGD